MTKSNLDLAALYTHDREATDQALTSQQLTDVDRCLLPEHPEPEPPTVIGLAVDEPSAELGALVSVADMITPTTAGLAT